MPKQRKSQRGGNISTCQSTVPSWHNAGVEPSSSNAVALSAKINDWQFTRTLPDGSLYQAGQLEFNNSCGTRYPDFVPKTGGAKKSLMNKVKNVAKKTEKGLRKVGKKTLKETKKVMKGLEKGSKKMTKKIKSALQHSKNIRMTLGKDGKKYFFKNGRRVKNPKH
jgi:hypothetical protein